MEFKVTSKVLADLENLSDEAFVDRHSVTLAKARLIRNQYKIKRKMKSTAKNVFFAEDVARMMELRAAGLSYLKVGHVFNIGASQAREIIKLAEANGFESYPPRPSNHEGEI